MKYTDLIDEFDDVEEFDIQKTVLKKRDDVKDLKVYVEYDRLTYSIISISPVKIETPIKRNRIEIVYPSQLTAKILDNKIPLSKIVIKKNKETGKFELHQSKQVYKGEFDFKFATTKEQSYFHINCDVIAKNIEVLFDYEMFKMHFGEERIIERDLADFPDAIEIYCIDKNERSRLYDRITVDTLDLFQTHNIRYRAPWLPNSEEEMKKISFVYYNDNQIISTGKTSKKTKNNLTYKPNILYNQEGNVLKLQSTMQNVTSFKLKKDITLYPYSEYDPTKILGSIKLSSDQFNNYNYLEVKLSTTKKVKITSDCFHLHIEDSNDNAY
jgi:hypothetical protein